MPKFRTTNKEMTREALTYAVGYCDLQYLFRFENPVAYTAGIFGWNSDIYLLKGNTYISTGYRPCGYRLNDGWIYKALDRYAEERLSEVKDYYALKLEFDGLIELLYRVVDLDYRSTSPIWKEYREEYKKKYKETVAKIAEITGYTKETAYKY